MDRTLSTAISLWLLAGRVPAGRLLLGTAIRRAQPGDSNPCRLKRRFTEEGSGGGASSAVRRWIGVRRVRLNEQADTKHVLIAPRA